MNIETAFRRMRALLIAFVVLSGLVVIVVVYAAFSFAQSAREKIYVLDNGKSLMLALAQDVSQNRPVEARDHVRRFHELFFTLSPDEKAIEYNVSQALALADESAFLQYQNLKEKGFYNNLISANISQTVQIDSVVVDMNQYPYHAVCYGRQVITRSTSITYRNLVSECLLRNVQRSDFNPHGFLIEKWQVLKNADLKVVER